MNSHLISSLAIVVLCMSSALCWAGPTDIAVVDKLPANKGYKKIWQPFIAKWNEKHYVVSYGLQLMGKGDMGDMVCSISKDRGRTWSDPITIFDHRIPNGSVRYAYNNSVLFQPPGQDVLWCFAMRTPMHYRDSEDAKLCAAYSGDGGYSWTPVELAMDYHGPLITCAGIVPVPDDDGTRYLLPIHRNSIRHEATGDRQHFVLESRSLLRWKISGVIPPNVNKPAWIHEGNIAEGDANDELKDGLPNRCRRERGTATGFSLLKRQS